MLNNDQNHIDSLIEAKVAIVGGGLSGLSLAYYLQKQNIKVTLFEKAKLGGLIQTQNLGVDGFIETAANGFLGHPEILKISAEIGAQPVMAPKGLGRFIFRSQPRKWPLSFMASLKLVKVIFMWVFFKNQIKPLPHESMRSWGNRFFGEEITQYLLEPALRGIFAGDLDKLSASLWFQKITGKEKKNRTKGLLSFTQGMGEFCEKLSLFLLKNNVEIRCEEVKSLSVLYTEFNLIVVATPPPEAVQLLQEELPAKAQLLKRIEMRSIVSLTYILKAKEGLSGYGCLFPQVEKFNALGVLWSRDIFSIHGTTPVERWISLWGPGKHLQSSDAEQKLIAAVNADRQHLYGRVPQTPKAIILHKWPMGLPHMTVDLENILPALKKISIVGNKIPLILHGNYLGEMGTTDLVLRSQRLTEEIKSLLINPNQLKNNDENLMQNEAFQ
jgi:oxygen-dependent protoporphyrinogen oxidase